MKRYTMMTIGIPNATPEDVAGIRRAIARKACALGYHKYGRTGNQILHVGSPGLFLAALASGEVIPVLLDPLDIPHVVRVLRDAATHADVLTQSAIRSLAAQLESPPPAPSEPRIARKRYAMMTIGIPNATPEDVAGIRRAIARKACALGYHKYGRTGNQILHVGSPGLFLAALASGEVIPVLLDPLDIPHVVRVLRDAATHADVLTQSAIRSLAAQLESPTQ